MDKLTLEHIAPYLPYGLKGLLTLNREEDFSEYDFDFEKFKKGTVWDYIGYADGKYNIPMGESYIDGMIYGNENTYVNFQYGIKPILRPMDLTKPITIEGKEVIPIVELAKIALPLIYKNIPYKLSIKGSKEEPDFNYCFDDGKIFTVSIYLDGACDFSFNWKGKQNESLKLFKWLYANKFDVEGLIEKGLAIDVNTLETNPYE